MSITYDPNWPIGTEIIFEDGVRGILRPSKLGQVQRDGKSLWCLVDNNGNVNNPCWLNSRLGRAGEEGWEIKQIILPKDTKMTRVEIIGLLKYGFPVLWREVDHYLGKTSFPTTKNVFISFGQWSEEVQKLAREIGAEFFQYLSGSMIWQPANQFQENICFRLRSDYEDKPEAYHRPDGEGCVLKEYEYLVIKKDSMIGKYIITDRIKILANGERQRLPNISASIAPSLVGFECYANADKEHLHICGNAFDPETCKYVVIKKGQ